MSTDTSIGPGPGRGGNDNPGNADGRGNKTLGDSKQATQSPPAGAGEVVPGARPRPGVAKGAEAYPDGPNVEASPWELEAARGNPPPKDGGQDR